MSSVNNIVPPSPPRPAAPSLPSLLDANQYAQTAQWLQAAQQKAEEEGDVACATLIAAAHNLCEICLKLQNEAKDYYHTYLQAVTRNNELEQQLVQLLQLLQQPLKTAVSSQSQLPKHHPETAAPTIWQRVTTFFRAEKPILPETAVSRQKEPAPFPPPQPEEKTDLNSLPLATAQTKQKLRDDLDPGIVQTQKQISEPILIIYCLGAFRLYHDTNLITQWNGLKGQMIFKYLVTRRGKPIPKDVLMELFWPEVDQDAARRNLHQAIYSLRQTLKKDGSNIRAIRFENACYAFDPDIEVWLDYEEFQRHVRTGQQLERNNSIAQAMAEYGIAEGIYQGDFLAEDIYEDWTQPLRERLQLAYVDIANRLSRQYFQQSEYAAAIAICQKLLTIDNCYESAHYRLMRCYVAQNQRHLAIRQYLHCRETLQTELNISPSGEINILFRELTNQ